MNPTARKVFWALSVVGIAASVVVYGLSFSFDLVDQLYPLTLPLFVVMWVLGLLMVLDHKASSGTWRWRWNELTVGKPAWVAFWFYLLTVNVAGHFIWSIHENGNGVPAIVDGDYVLDSHGHILKELTAEEYPRLRSLELRSFAMLYLYLCFSHAVYWYYAKNDSPQDPNL
jgi:hypothetical protein